MRRETDPLLEVVVVAVREDRLVELLRVLGEQTGRVHVLHDHEIHGIGASGFGSEKVLQINVLDVVTGLSQMSRRSPSLSVTFGALPSEVLGATTNVALHRLTIAILWIAFASLAFARGVPTSFAFSLSKKNLLIFSIWKRRQECEDAPAVQSASFPLALTFTLPPKLPSDSSSYFANWFLHKSPPTAFVMAVT